MNRHKMAHKVSIYAVFWVVVFFFSSEVFAQSPLQGISVSPSTQKIEVEAETGELPVVVTVSNHGNSVVNLKLSVVDFGQLNDTGGIFFIGRERSELDRNYSLSGWLEVPEQITLQAGETKNITARIINRQTLTPGGHYGAIIVTSAPAVTINDTSNNAIALQDSVSALVFVTKHGGERFGLNLKQLELSSRWFNLPHKVDLTFENAGNVHVVARGLVEIKNAAGKLVAKGIINQDSLELLPERTRTMSVVVRQLSNFIWPGLYRVQATYRYDGKQEGSVREENIFYIGPYFPLLTAVILIILFYWFIRKTRASRI